MSLSSASVNRPIATLMVYLGLCLIGLFALFKLPVDLMPNASASSLTIFIGIRGGLPPEDIETLVTKVVEEAVATTQHLRNVMSVSRKDRAVTTLIFEPGTDVSFAALEVQERLAKIKNKLPKDIEKPVVAHYSENDYPVVILSLTSDKYSPEQLREMVDNNLKPALTRTNGVANVEVGGGRERKILVEFDQSRLDAYQLPIRQVINQIGTNNLNLLTGKTETNRDEFYVRAMGQYQTMEDMKNLTVTVTKEGSRIKLGDIADVRDFYMEAQSYARLNRKPTVSVYVQRESNTNTIRVAAKVKAVIEKYKAEVMDPEISMMVVSDQSIFIKEAVDNVVGNLTSGAILTWFIIFLFLKEWKHTTIVFLSVPVTVLITFGLMLLSKISLNVMTLSAIALGIGMVVDAAAVVLENVIDRKREALKHDPNADLKEVTVKATDELSTSLIASTMTVIVVFLPIVFINKQVKILYSGLAYTITFSMVIALFVAVTMVPILASRITLPDYRYVSPRLLGLLARWLRRLPSPPRSLLSRLPPSWDLWIAVREAAPPAAAPKAPRRWLVKLAEKQRGQLLAQGAEGGALPPPAARGKVKRAWAFVKAAAARAYRGLREHPRRTFVHWCGQSLRYQFYIFSAMMVVTALCAFMYVFLLEKDFMGSTEQNEFIIFVELPAGAKLDISDQIVGEVEKILSETPEIAKVVKTAAARVEGWSSKVYVTLSPRAERTRSVADIISELRPKVAEIGAVYDTFIYFSEPEASKEFLIDVFGHDYEKLRDMAVGIANRLQNVKGLTDIKLRYKPGRPEVKINLDKDRAALFGFTVKDVAETLHAQIRGLRATYFYTANEQIETIGRLQEKSRKTLDDLNYLTLVASDGTIVPLQQMASFEFTLTPSEIWRKDKERMIQVSSNREKLALSTAAQRARRELKGMEVPAGYYWQIGGDYVDMVQNEKEFRFAFLIMVGLVFIVLASIFESTVQACLIMATIPMALIGSIPLLYFTHTPATMGVYIGMIMLGGIVVSAAIILVEKINQAREEGRPLMRASLEASWIRLSPICNTSLTTIVDLIPMVTSKSESAQLWAPLALTVIGGATVSTFLTLFMIPQLYYHVEHYKELMILKFFSEPAPTER